MPPVEAFAGAGGAGVPSGQYDSIQAARMTRSLRDFRHARKRFSGDSALTNLRNRVLFRREIVLKEPAA